MVKYRGPFVLGMPEEAWFDVDMIQKDLRLALDMAARLGRHRSPASPSPTSS